MSIKISCSKSSNTLVGKRTEVIYGTENVTKFSADCLSLVKTRIDVCGDYTMPSVILASKEVRNGYFGINERGYKD